MEKIAIIGLSCLFPGAHNPAQYWDVLTNERDTASELTSDLLGGVDPLSLFTPQKGVPDKYYCMRGGYIRDFTFDSAHYPEFVNHLDDLYQWSLYVSREALKDSGYLDDQATLNRTGLILGNLSFPTRSSTQMINAIYSHAVEQALGRFKLGELPTRPDLALENMAISGYPAELVSKIFGLGALQFCLDAACASSLYAVKLACDYLATRKADMMLAGAVSCSDPYNINMGFSIFHAYPEPHQESRPLNQGSGGLTASEGAGMFVLKRYNDALRDDDHVYAVISGAGLSNDGSGKHLLTPNARGQIKAFERAYQNSDRLPEDIEYVECHATGTPLGDVTELNSMLAFFGQNPPKVGSSKSNLGHLLTAAGMAGMIKIILSMQTSQIPPTIKIDRPVQPKDGAIEVVTQPTPWTSTHKRAAINAFGFGGTNAHLILEDAPTQLASAQPLSDTPMAIVGMDAFFGPFTDLASFEQAIYNEQSGMRPLPPQRWQAINDLPEVMREWGIEAAPEGAYIDRIDIDFLKFKIPPIKNDQPIAQQLLMLHVANNALKDAGIQAGSNVAVLIGMNSDLGLHRFRSRVDVGWQIREGLAQANITMTPDEIDELEQIARDSVHNWPQVNQYTSFIGNIIASRISALWDFSGASFTISSDDDSVFKALEVAHMMLAAGEVEAVLVGGVDLTGSVENVFLRQDAYVGEGAGAVVLKLSSDNAYAVIQSLSFEPEPLPTDIDYVEHVEDLYPVIGHTHAASGIATLIKTALCLHNKYTPHARPWITDRYRAAIEGNNDIQLVLEAGSRKATFNNPHTLLPMSGDSLSSLLEQLSNLQDLLSSDKSLRQIASHCFHRYDDADPYAVALVGESKDALLQEIDHAQNGLPTAFANGSEWQTRRGSYAASHPLKGKVAFVYPGAFNSYPGVGKELFHFAPDLLERFTAITDDVAASLSTDYLYGDKAHDLYNDAVALISAGMSFSILYTRLLRDDFGIQADAAFGYSMGETSMICAMGIWQDMPLARHKLNTSPLFKHRLVGEMDILAPEETWANYILLTTPEAVRAQIAHEPRVFLTHINTPQEVLISGDEAACERVIAALGCKSVRSPIASIIHCDVTRQVYDEFLELNDLPTFDVPNVDFYFSGTTHPKSVAEALSLGSVQLVDFPALVKRAYEDGVRIFIELGARNTCTSWVKTILKNQPHAAVAANWRRADDSLSMMRLLARLVGQRVPVDLSKLYDDETVPGKSLMRQVVPGGDRILDVVREKYLPDVGFAASYPARYFEPIEFPEREIMQNTLSEHLGLLRSRQLAIKTMSADIQSQMQMVLSVIPELVWDEQALLEFAIGEIAPVFGNDYAIIDQYPRRVRLPSPPYLLVSRVTRVEGEKNAYRPSSMTTEYDIPYNAWYSVDGQVPWAVSVESGQCDLLLISYLGIDFQNKGERVYRLLDCTLTFLDVLPREGETLRYDISINSYAQNGDTLLFFFSYECFIGERMVLKMDGGCAGFFTDAELAQGKGVIRTPQELEARAHVERSSFTPLLRSAKTQFDQSDLLYLVEGNHAACFGENYNQGTRNRSLRLPPKPMLMIDRVASIDLHGGLWGLGEVIAEKDLWHDDWHFVCHFVDDQVMAGSLMAEGCGQLLQIFMLYLGLQTQIQDARFQPIFDLPQIVRCRGQVTPRDGTLTYRMEITEIGLDPMPYAKANIDIILDDIVVVDFRDLGLQLIDQEAYVSERVNVPAVFNEHHIDHFATGSIVECFGPEYEIYSNRRVQRTPNGDLQLINRITEANATRYNFESGANLISEYDVPPQPWYLQQNDYPVVPYSILMEIALQPCGFLSAYLGSTLIDPDEDYYFRNLDGHGRMLNDIDIRGKTIQNEVTLISSTALQGVIIQKFEFAMSVDGLPYYVGEAVFGYFTQQALANQVGLDWGEKVPPKRQSGLTTINLRDVETRSDLYHPPIGQPHYHLPHHQLDLLDTVRIADGYVFAEKTINPSDWFYIAHFYEDPVMPGSLGLEAIFQAMKVYALYYDLGAQFTSPHFEPMIDHQITWKYRGQIIQTDGMMTLEVDFDDIQTTTDQVTLIGTASLWKDNLRIYEVTQIAMRIVETG